MSNAPLALIEELAATQPRLAQQLAFLIEVDRLKSILRRTCLLDGSRNENSAEHSWHLALSALVLAEHAPAGTDPVRAVAMLLVHDCVEVHAGDTFAYDTAGAATQHDREQIAAARVFGLLPPDQGMYIRSLWEEFDLQQTPTAQFANALDRLHPFLQNCSNEGGTWKSHNVGESAVWSRAEPVRNGMPSAWPLMQAIVRRAVELGHLTPKSPAA
jgi:putative hydrolase of HD superfamily